MPKALAVPMMAFSSGLIAELAVDVCIGSDVFIAVEWFNDDVGKCGKGSYNSRFKEVNVNYLRDFKTSYS